MFLRNAAVDYAESKIGHAGTGYKYLSFFF